MLSTLLPTAFLVAVTRSVTDSAFWGSGSLIVLLCIAIMGAIVVRATRGRVLDAGFARSHSRWLFTIWLLSFVSIAIPNRYWPLGLVLLLLLIVAGGFIRSKPLSTGVNLASLDVEPKRPAL